MSWESFRKKNLSSTQPHCRKLFLTQQKRKGKRVKQCKQFISFYLNSFSKGGVWACHNYSFLSSISLLLWIGFCEPAGPWHPPQPCLTESHSDVKLRTSPYVVCVIFTTKVIAILSTMALQLKQWAVGILCTEVPASALTTSKFSFLISGGHKTWEYKVKLVLSPFSQPTVHLRWGQHHGRTKDHGLEKIFFFLSLAIYLISHTGTIKQTWTQRAQFSVKPTMENIPPLLSPLFTSATVINSPSINKSFLFSWATWTVCHTMCYVKGGKYLIFLHRVLDITHGCLHSIICTFRKHPLMSPSANAVQLKCTWKNWSESYIFAWALTDVLLN